MAKQKKRGLFSWLGLGRENKKENRETQPECEQTTKTQLSELQADDVHSDVVENESCVAAHQKQAEITEAAPAAASVADDRIASAPLSAQQAEITEAAPAAASVADDRIASAPLSAQQAEITEAAPAAASVADDRIASAPLSAQQAEITETAPAAGHRDDLQEKGAKEGFFRRLKRSLLKTRQNIGFGFFSFFQGKKIDDELFEQLEEHLLIADVGMETTSKIINNLTRQASRRQLKDADALYGLLKEEMTAILEPVTQPLDIEKDSPFVILMVGVNGVGKTTTIGKLARQFQAQGKSVMLAAGDTFRAAAVEQLQVWGERNAIPVIAQHTGADSASVIYDSLQAAKARGIDVLIADTAGRLQNKAHLMDELKKITRVVQKLNPMAPHEVMLTLDASTGQNAVSQAKLFNEAVGLTGLTLTKLDGTAKGGVIFSLADKFGIPIRYIGVGEGIDDLRPFQSGDFIEALFAREDEVL